jgi:hypothetical protein
MVRTTVDLRDAGRVHAAPFLSDDGQAVAWVELGRGHQAAVFGTPENLRALAEASTAAADQAEELQPVAERLAAAGMFGLGSG